MRPCREEEFGWPSEPVTLTLNGLGNSKNQIVLFDDWTIPENVTLFLNDTHALCSALWGTSHTPTITVRGTIQDSSTGAHNFADCNLTVEDGGTLEINSLRIGKDCTLTVKQGAILDAYHDEHYSEYSRMSLRLDGTLHGIDAVINAGIVVRPGFNNEDSDAYLTGSMTITRQIIVEGSRDSFPDLCSTLTIAENAQVTLNEDSSLSLEHDEGGAVLNVEGTLTVNTFARSDGEIHLGQKGVLEWMPFSQLARSRYTMFDSETGEHVTIERIGTITGSGILKLFGEYKLLWDINDECLKECLVTPEVYVNYLYDPDSENNAWGVDCGNSDLSIRPDFIDPEVMIWRNWRDGVQLQPDGNTWTVDGNRSLLTFTGIDEQPLLSERLKAAQIMAASYDSETGRMLSLALGSLLTESTGRSVTIEFPCALSTDWVVFSMDNGTYAPLCAAMKLLDGGTTAKRTAS